LHGVETFLPVFIVHDRCPTRRDGAVIEDAAGELSNLVLAMSLPQRRRSAMAVRAADDADLEIGCHVTSGIDAPEPF